MGGYDEAKQKIRDLPSVYGVMYVSRKDVLAVLGDLQAEAQKTVKELLVWRKKAGDLYYEDEKMGRGRINKAKLILWLNEFDKRFEKAEKLLETTK